MTTAHAAYTCGSFSELFSIRAPIVPGPRLGFSHVVCLKHCTGPLQSELWSKLLEGGCIGDYIGDCCRGY